MGSRTTDDIRPGMELPQNRAGYIESHVTAANLAYGKTDDGKYFMEQNDSAGIATVNASGKLPPGWSIVDHTHDPDGGKLQAALKTADAFHLKDADGRQIVAFRGTIPGASDWVRENIPQGLNIRSDQGPLSYLPESLRPAVQSKYDAAAVIGEAFKDQPNVSFTGHSLGGGLATLAAEVSTVKGGSQKSVVAIDQAWCTSETLTQHGCEPHTQRAQAVRVRNESGELLTGLHSMLPDYAPGAVQIAKSSAGLMWGMYNAGKAVMSGNVYDAATSLRDVATNAVTVATEMYKYPTMAQAVRDQRAESDVYNVGVVGAKPTMSNVYGHSLGAILDGQGKVIDEVAKVSHASGKDVPSSLPSYDQLDPHKLTQLHAALDGAASKEVAQSRQLQALDLAVPHPQQHQLARPGTGVGR